LPTSSSAIVSANRIDELLRIAGSRAEQQLRGYRLRFKVDRRSRAQERWAALRHGHAGKRRERQDGYQSFNSGRALTTI
jgi:hypothetical protein